MSNLIETLMKEVNVTSEQMSVNNGNFFNNISHQVLEGLSQSDEYSVEQRDELIKAFVVVMSLDESQMNEWKVTNRHEGLVLLFINMLKEYKTLNPTEFVNHLKEMKYHDLLPLMNTKNFPLGFIKLNFITLALVDVIEHKVFTVFNEELKIFCYRFLENSFVLNVITENERDELKLYIENQIEDPKFKERVVIKKIYNDYS